MKLLKIYEILPTIRNYSTDPSCLFIPIRNPEMSKTKDPFLRCSRWHQYLADILFDPDKYFVFTPWCERIGHITIEFMLAITIAIRDNKQLILIPQIKSVNKEIFLCHLNCPTYERKDVRIWILKIAMALSGVFHFGYNGIRSKIIKIIPFLSKIIPNIFFYPRYGIEEGKWGNLRLKGTDFYLDWHLLLSNEFQVELNSQQLAMAETFRKKMKIPDDAWFVCLHVREQGYVGRSVRDADIMNYLPAIKHITRKGGYVIRMGDSSMTALPHMENVIDYAKSGFWSDLMDLYLISKCWFYIGCASGPLDLAKLLKKPYCLVNVPELASSYPLNANNMCIPKRVYSKKKKRFLTLQEGVNPAEINYNADYIFVENSPEEILETVKEYLFFMENGRFHNTDQLQNEFRTFRRNCYENYIKQNSYGIKLDLISGTLPSQGRIGSFFLKRYWKNTSYLEKLTNLYNRENE